MALQIGAFDCPPKNVNKPTLFHFQSAGVPPKRVLREFPVTQDAVLPVGQIFCGPEVKYAENFDLASQELRSESDIL